MADAAAINTKRLKLIAMAPYFDQAGHAPAVDAGRILGRPGLWAMNLSRRVTGCAGGFFGPAAGRGLWPRGR